MYLFIYSLCLFISVCLSVSLCVCVCACVLTYPCVPQVKDNFGDLVGPGEQTQIIRLRQGSLPAEPFCQSKFKESLWQVSLGGCRAPGSPLS